MTAFYVTGTARRSETCLRHIARLVVNLAFDTDYIFQALADGGAYKLDGPDGIKIVVTPGDVATNYEYGSILIEEIDFGTLRLHLGSEHFEEREDKSLTTPLWANKAFELCRNADERNVVAQLCFSQLPLKVAAKLLNIPSNSLIAHFLKEQLDKGGNAQLLRLATTRAAIDPNEALIDLRALAAWLLLAREFGGDVAAEQPSAEQPADTIV